MKLLLHACCGPCATYPSFKLTNDQVDFDLYFYNPNIHPLEEFDMRLENLDLLANLKSYKLIIDNEYREDLWIDAKEYPTRCDFCYRFRLEKAFEYAKENGYSDVSTTLLVSPYQQHDLIKSLAEQLSLKTGIGFYYEDFRVGYREGQKMAKDLGLYRQKYCGCILSLEERMLELIKKENLKESV